MRRLSREIRAGCVRFLRARARAHKYSYGALNAAPLSVHYAKSSLQTGHIRFHQDTHFAQGERERGRECRFEKPLRSRIRTVQIRCVPRGLFHRISPASPKLQKFSCPEQEIRIRRSVTRHARFLFGRRESAIRRARDRTRVGWGVGGGGGHAVEIHRTRVYEFRKSARRSDARRARRTLTSRR